MGNGPSNDSCRSPKNSDGADTPDAGLAANLLAWKGAWKSRKGLHGVLGRKKPAKEWSLHRRKMAWSENMMRGKSLKTGGSCPGIRKQQHLSAPSPGLSTTRRQSAACASCPVELSNLAPEAPPVPKSSPMHANGQDPSSPSGIPALLSPTTSSSVTSDERMSFPIKISNVMKEKELNHPDV